ncbi:MAG TPA: response regulator [Roseiflexaceae bacterium]|nr:response regulator [Roseiflexaceae bacterium]
MSKHILIVDDDTAIAGFYTRYLTFEGYRVTIAESCADADALLATWRPDIIIADWWLPDADGDVWASSLRMRPNVADIPIIVVTGRDLPRATINRLNDYKIMRFQKPFSLEEFSATLAHLLVSTPNGRSLNTKRDAPLRV